MNEAKRETPVMRELYDHCCGHCTYQEDDGTLARHCQSCCAWIVGMMRNRLEQSAAAPAAPSADECLTSEMLRRAAAIIERSDWHDEYEFGKGLRRRAEQIEPKQVQLASGGSIEATCQRCGRANVQTWSAQSPLWNAVLRERETGADKFNILCPNCFASLATAAGLGGHWRLSREGDVAALWKDDDGRVWNEQNFMWELAAGDDGVMTEELTREWCNSIGASASFIDDWWQIDFKNDDIELTILQKAIEISQGDEGVNIPMEIRTRGDVLRLAAALGISLPPLTRKD